MCVYGIPTYAKNNIARVERIYGCVSKVSTPLPTTDYHPEMNKSPVLKYNDHRKCQMLLWMLQWIVTIGRRELSQLVVSLNCFSACPRGDHLDLAVSAFEYVKMTLRKVIAIESRLIKFKRS